MVSITSGVLVLLVLSGIGATNSIRGSSRLCGLGWNKGDNPNAYSLRFWLDGVIGWVIGTCGTTKDVRGVEGTLDLGVGGTIT